MQLVRFYCQVKYDLHFAGYGNLRVRFYQVPGL